MDQAQNEAIQMALVKFITDNGIDPLLKQRTDLTRIALALLSIAEGLVEIADYLPDDFIPMLEDMIERVKKLRPAQAAPH